MRNVNALSQACFGRAAFSLTVGLRAGRVAAPFLLGMYLAAAAQAEEHLFQPAFVHEDIDFANCRQYVNGKAASADPRQVERALGWFPAGQNMNSNLWEVSAGPDEGEITYDFLVAFKRPAEVGTLCLSPAEGLRATRGSVSGGALFYSMEKDGGAIPEPSAQKAWTPVRFADPPQHLRFAVLPPQTKIRALLYRDVRVRDAAQLFYLKAFRARFQDLTPGTMGACDPGPGAGDPQNVPSGKMWELTMRRPVGETESARFTLAWNEAQTLNGVYLFCNATKLRLLAYEGTGDPLTAGKFSWKPVAASDRWPYPQALPSWKWLTFPELRTKAVRIEAADTLWTPKTFWIQGFAVLRVLGDRPPLAIQRPAAAEPFRFPVQYPETGDGALVIDDAQGRRVRNLFAQTYCAKGTNNVEWDLKDDNGAYVSPGKYSWKTIVGPQLELRYGITPYPNLQNYFPERMPWRRAANAEHGWMADIGGNFACATMGDRVYFGATASEAGECFVACDLEGRRMWADPSWGYAGVYRMTADDKNVYPCHHGVMFRVDPATHRKEKAFSLNAGPHPRGYLSGVAARDGKVCLAYAGEPGIDNAALAGDVDLRQCQPPAAEDPPWECSMIRLLRIAGTPPGFGGLGSEQAQPFIVSPASDQPQGNGRLFLEFERLGRLVARREAAASGRSEEQRNRPPRSLDDVTAEAQGPDLEQQLDPERENRGPFVSVLAFKRPVPLGSVVFPWPQVEGTLRLSALKADAPYPPRPEQEADWVPFESSGAPGWNCVPAPPGVMTRAVRVTFEPKENGARFRGLEGIRLVDRRYANLSPSARVRVSSGRISPTGEWDAERTEPLGADKPGVYLMEWNEEQTVAGLAFKEIDGATSEIDVWEGPVSGELPMHAKAHDAKSKEPGWRHVYTYRQERRVGDYDASNNMFAWYMDGYVDFQNSMERGPVKTRAIRIRVTEQWYDQGLVHHVPMRTRRHDGRYEGQGLHRSKSYMTHLDTRLCKIMGVAVLSPLGGEPPRDPMAYARIEIWDGVEGKFLKELPARPGWDSLCFGPDGALYAIHESHRDICRVDLETGTMTPVVRDCWPTTFAVGQDGSFYVASYAGEEKGRSPITVYDAQGKELRGFGKPGRLKVGLWDPQRFGDVRQMCIDRAGSLWVVEGQNNPRRIVQYKTDGTFVKELLGNTQYGGFGSMDRTNPTRAFHGEVEFAIDWTNHTSRIRALLGAGFSTGGNVALTAGEPVMRQCNGRLYVVTANNALGIWQPHGVVYLYDETNATVRPAAAMGSAEYFLPLRRSDILAMLPAGASPRGFEFLWYDRSGNGQVDADEVSFNQKVVGDQLVEASSAVGPFDERLGCSGNGCYYEVERFLPTGVPVYRRSPQPGRPVLRLNNGNFLTMYGWDEATLAKTKAKQGEIPPTANFVSTPSGQTVWSYPAGGGVSGLYIPGWVPGRVSNQLALIGHEEAREGDLGEFVVMNDNTGQWRIWTADGLLAGNIFYHQADPRARLFGPPDVKFGDRMDPLSAKQEHFHGFFTKNERDNRYYVVAGFNHMSILEVRGLEKFRRGQGGIEVTREQLERARLREAEQAKRLSGGKAAALVVMDVEGSAPSVDGTVAPEEWPEATSLPGSPDVLFCAAHDSANLYLSWRGSVGPLANDGTDFRRLFKTGACLDFQIGVDEQADPARTSPVQGDQRLLITVVDGRPCVVLYQPSAPGATPGEAWSTQTPAGGETRFERVAEISQSVSVALTNGKDFELEAAIPLKVLGLHPRAGLRLKGDWGILTSEDGHQVKARGYWSNLSATGTADEPTEARLEPQFWGRVLFDVDKRRKLGGSDSLDQKPAGGMGDILKELDAID